MSWLGRSLLFFAFAIFWGGLTFYTGIVIRVSHAVLDDPMVGGLITQGVTRWLQVLGFIALVAMVGNGLAVRAASARHGNILLACAGLLAVSLVGLVVTHGQLDAVIDIESHTITDRDAFDAGHRRYNRWTTLEWIASLAYGLITVAAWRRVDTGNALSETRKS